MRLSRHEHTSRPWRIHALTPDFRVEDVWAVSTPGAGPDDFPRFLQGIVGADLEHGVSGVVAALFAIRWKLGALLGWDRPAKGIGTRVPTLRDRLPAELVATARDAPHGGRFTPLYLLADEYAAEIANRTMHGVVHIGWLPDGAGGYRGQLAVLVKPNGVLGRAYMAAIDPLRHVVVYPTLMRHLERSWSEPPRPVA